MAEKADTQAEAALLASRVATHAARLARSSMHCYIYKINKKKKKSPQRRKR